MRDDFKEDVRRTVAQRVGWRCSNPDCRADTTGPQTDASKALNVGVAAHISAASPGGPRYEPALSSSDRKEHKNAIWLCQNCAKLVDNDPIRFPRDLLRRWKIVAESAALSTIGRTGAASQTAQHLDRLQPYIRIKIKPMIPRRFEQEECMIERVENDFFAVSRGGFQFSVPKRAVANILSFGDRMPCVLILDGRVQWMTFGQRWEYLPEGTPSGPTGDYGLAKFAPNDYPQQIGIDPSSVRWFREERVAEFLAKGWHVFYDGDGKYLKSGDTILMSKNP